jgi:cytochrome c oxidase cbb3-type subunit II
MDRVMVIVIGALLTFTSSWLGLVLLPFWQLNGEQVFAQDADTVYPRPLTGSALAGVKVYQANGCIYCHSQQVRSETFGNWWEDGQMKTGADIKRGWGLRRTVSRDYIHDRPILLGTMRTGPDLANVGSRRYSEAWHHNHMMNPRAVNSWSVMPSFAFLYQREKVIGGVKSDKALRLGREWTMNPGHRWKPTDTEWAAIQQSNPNISLEFWLTSEEADWQIVPTTEGEDLVAYMMELRKAETPLPEAKE